MMDSNARTFETVLFPENFSACPSRSQTEDVSLLDKLLRRDCAVCFRVISSDKLTIKIFAFISDLILSSRLS